MPEHKIIFKSLKPCYFTIIWVNIYVVCSFKVLPRIFKLSILFLFRISTSIWIRLFVFNII
nr:MAG TPA: hypothetical protein [Caudoviricetes sp.]